MPKIRIYSEKVLTENAWIKRRLLKAKLIEGVENEKSIKLLPNIEEVIKNLEELTNFSFLNKKELHFIEWSKKNNFPKYDDLRPDGKKQYDSSIKKAQKYFSLKEEFPELSYEALMSIPNINKSSIEFAENLGKYSNNNTFPSEAQKIWLGNLIEQSIEQSDEPKAEERKEYSVRPHKRVYIYSEHGISHSFKDLKGELERVEKEIKVLANEPKSAMKERGTEYINKLSNYYEDLSNFIGDIRPEYEAWEKIKEHFLREKTSSKDMKGFITQFKKMHNNFLEFGRWAGKGTGEDLKLDYSLNRIAKWDYTKYMKEHKLPAKLSKQPYIAEPWNLVDLTMFHEESSAKSGIKFETEF